MVIAEDPPTVNANKHEPNTKIKRLKIINLSHTLLN